MGSWVFKVNPDIDLLTFCHKSGLTHVLTSVTVISVIGFPPLVALQEGVYLPACFTPRTNAHTYTHTCDPILSRYFSLLEVGYDGTPTWNFYTATHLLRSVCSNTPHIKVNMVYRFYTDVGLTAI